MKFRKITFVGHHILGDISYDFTDKEGNTVDTIIIAGENGCGKSVFLNELYSYNPTITYSNRYKKLEVEVEISDSEKQRIQENLTRNKLPLMYGNRIKILQDFSRGTNYNDTVHYNNMQDKTEKTVNYFSIWKDNGLFKSIFSDVEINFTPKAINYVTATNVDEMLSGAIKSSSNIATEITQLLIDIDNLDNADLAKWVRLNPNIAPTENVQNIRMKRFTNAFHSIFPNKRYVGINNINNHKVVEFEEHGKIMSIEKLSSGEKQIVFRGGFLLKNQKTAEGFVILVDEPEISLHPKWQLEIMTFLKNLFTTDGQQTSQLIVATHSPFIIHNSTRANDKVIVMKKDDAGQVYVSQNPEYYSWTEAQLVKEAFDIYPYIDKGKINVFVEGETDEKYYNKALDVFGVDKERISFKWIGRNTQKGCPENTGASALNNAFSFFKANPAMSVTPIVLFYDCDTKKGDSDSNNIHIRTMKGNNTNTLYKKGIENLLVLPQEFDKDQFYSTNDRVDDYGAVIRTQSLDKMKLCDYICSLTDNELKLIFANLNTEIQQLLLIK